MRAYEFLKENATSGATGSGSVATVVKPLGSVHRREQFFGGDPNASIYSNNPMARRNDSPTKKKKKDREIK